MREQDDLVGDFTYREWHALLNGLYVGARWGDQDHEYERETHYWRGGYLVGTVARYLLVAYLIRLIQDND